MIDRGKRSKTLSEVKPVENVSKNLQSFLEISPVSRFVSHRARMSGEFDSRKDSQSTKFEQRSQIFIKLRFRELSDSKLLSGLHAFDKMAIIH